MPPLARADLRTIRRTSRQRWSDDQSDQYTIQLDNALSVLTEFPAIGRAFGELGPGLRGHKAGQHMIYDLIDEDTIRVVCILHARMDATAQFES